MEHTKAASRRLREADSFLMSALWACALSLVFVALASAQQTANVQVTGTNYGYTQAGVYTSPYYGTITPTGGTPVSGWMICDDYYDNSYIGESWEAYATPLSDLPQASPSVVLYGGTSWGGQTLDQVQEYEAVALLAETLLTYADSEATLSGQALTNAELGAAEYGFAIWDLTNNPDTTNSLGETTTNITCNENQVGNTGGCANQPNNVLEGLSSTEINTIVGTDGLISTAVADVGSATNAFDNLSNFSNVTIYNWAGGVTSGCGGTCPPPPQEFITVSTDPPTPMDEPSMPLLLGFYGVCVTCLGLAFRRRMASKPR